MLRVTEASTAPLLLQSYYFFATHFYALIPLILLLTGITNPLLAMSSSVQQMYGMVTRQCCSIPEHLSYPCSDHERCSGHRMAATFHAVHRVVLSHHCSRHYQNHYPSHTSDWWLKLPWLRSQLMFGLTVSSRCCSYCNTREQALFKLGNGFIPPSLVFQYSLRVRGLAFLLVQLSSSPLDIPQSRA